MALPIEIWNAQLAENLFPDNSFMNQSLNDDGFVRNKTVHLPQAGALPSVVRDRSSFPIPAAERSDSDLTYDMAEFSSDSTIVREIEKLELSYDKRASILRSHTNQLNLQCANWTQYGWAPAASAQIIRTTGDSRAAHAPGATGTRNKITIDDILDAKAVLDDMDVSETNRNMLIPAFMFNDLIGTYKKELLSLDYTGEARMEDGILTMLLGFNIFKRGRNNILTYTNAATPVKRAPDATTLAAANSAVLMWSSDMVRKAKGGEKVFIKYDDPDYQGDVINAQVRLGYSPVYTDFTGIVSIVEDHAA